MSASTAAERVILRDGDWELEQLLDGLGDDDDGTRRRPVIAETTIRYLVWVEDEYATADLQEDHELIEGAEVVDGDMTVTDPDDMDWWHIYRQPFGPDSAPVEGPAWKCPELRCHAYQPAGASYERRHGWLCPHAAEGGAR
ncbi:hypothetical protein CcI156_10940 [Frankia sp. CcI156]|uniref:hypothetical protein n=1 Tax=unclassified Frankia TaxID=2632575 RepID=UPI0003D048AB|nr:MULTISPECIES: hypothetical protein [unclassified Frankia]ETA02415.1 hypothetical protein CcI6DRAFT_02210 [Frankia sp. CcI6]KDA44861.1 hypothetical protein BMG523Draft_00385 [Frankia sp. BMG5.23]KFB04717.1 hypothetical protein ALLO2DRAFT_02438 [Frankia sp. Allo2]OFB44675.1 hypothetical protein Manayef4_07400 [Frankia sp. CgIM4]OHV55092.1 hypothetical protein CgIS1_11115 [Frankia sp. CgIS1]